VNREKNLIVLIAGIGDLVMATKAFRAIKNGMPKSELHLLTSTQGAAIGQNLDIFEKIHIFPIRELRKNKRTIFQITHLIKSLRKQRYSIAINLYPIGSYIGSLKMGLFFLLINAAVKIGHEKNGFGLFLDKKLPEKFFLENHLSDAMVKMTELAGGKPDDKNLTISWNKKAEAKWDPFLRKSRARGKKLIGINPGGDRPNRRWNSVHYSKIADKLCKNNNSQIIIFGGQGEEKIANKIEKSMRYNAKNLCGKLSLNELIFLISQLDLLVSNDSGPMHIAAATKTRVVAIFGPENADIFRPYTTPDLYRIIQKEVDCRPCQKEVCEQAVCLELISPEEVLENCKQLLGNSIA
jgi:lipopolysaccharide heptosyltransferase II